MRSVEDILKIQPSNQELRNAAYAARNGNWSRDHRCNAKFYDIDGRG